MSKGQTLRALVTERLAAAAEDIFVLFERTIAEYEEELCRSKEENQRKVLAPALNPRVALPGAGVQVSSLSPGPGLNQETTETPQIKEEPEEPRVKQEEELLPLAVCVKSEESSLFHHREEPQGEDFSSEPHFHSETEGLTEFSPDADDDWDPFAEADGNVYKQSRIRDGSTELFPQSKSAPETTVHNEDTSGAEEKTHHGSDCGERFTTSHTLHRHIRDHTREQPQSCTVCHKTFSNKHNLVRHSKTHTGEKPYSCSVCEKPFTVKGDLNKHLRIHTGEKPYGCSVCEKTFALKGDLNKHMRVHTGEKPYSCPLCEKAFALKGNLNQHMRFHTGEKPYSCPVCEKSFALKGDMNKHMRIHTGEKPYSCSVCEKPFAVKGDLKKHENSHRRETFQLFCV